MRFCLKKDMYRQFYGIHGTHVQCRTRRSGPGLLMNLSSFLVKAYYFSMKTQKFYTTVAWYVFNALKTYVVWY